eukprot:m.378022 g.378022  ORF g.378022 m.378022 type:complete len:50 (-) comp90570_c0_seq1:23-172(-)
MHGTSFSRDRSAFLDTCILSRSQYLKPHAISTCKQLIKFVFVGCVFALG